MTVYPILYTTSHHNLSKQLFFLTIKDINIINGNKIANLSIPFNPQSNSEHGDCVTVMKKKHCRLIAQIRIISNFQNKNSHC